MNNNNRMENTFLNRDTGANTTNRQHLYPGAFRSHLWGRTTTTTNGIGTGYTGNLSNTFTTPTVATTIPNNEPEAPSLSLGERVVWLKDWGPEIGTVRWIGRLPIVSPDWSVGVEFDKPISTGNGKFGSKQYFTTKPNHAVFLPIMTLMRAQDYNGDAFNERNDIKKDNTLKIPQQNCQDYHQHNEKEHTRKTNWERNRDTLRRLSVENKKIRFGSTTSLTNIVFEGEKQMSASPIFARKAITPNASPVMNRGHSLCTGKPPLPFKTYGDTLLEENKSATLFAQLETAIAKGQHGRAAALARELAMHRTSGTLSRLRRLDAIAAEDKNIIVSLYIEDKNSHQGPIPLNINAGMTVKMLKEKIEKEFNFQYNSQRWILGKTFAVNDSSTLASLDICTPGCPVFLYIVTPNAEEEKPEEAQFIDAEKSESISGVVTEKVADQETENEERKIEATSSDVDLGRSHNVERFEMLQEVFNVEVQGTDDDVEFEDAHDSIDEEEEVVIVEEEGETGSSAESELDKVSIESEENNEDAEAKQNYQELVQLEEQDLITNIDEFECPICYTDVETKTGVLLRECLHSFCKECLSKSVEYSEEAVIKCPFRNHEYSCDSHLTEREIKALVSPVLFDKHLQRSMSLAESRAANSFHCKSPDCPGWCLFEDNVNVFMCPVCSIENCLTCGAIHEGKNCRQYQDELEFEAALSEDAKKTKEYLDNMVKAGQAMHCPTCRVIVMKKWGCDWLKCSVCTTEICWVTKGPRWGLEGRGDTTGGCKCGIKGVRCHPLCNYCH